MPITIQELIASDTISQAVNKINFNFDQLLLNGGGPVGPQGPAGPTGPIGGRGIRGATWYNDPAVSPGTDPNTLIIPTVEEDDNYLQANGNVWKYNGTVWVLTNVNLTGPVGPAGSSFGFNYAGGYPGSNPITDQNVAYIVPMPGGTSSGANQATNQGVSVAVFGGVASTAVPPSGISFTNAFLIPDLMIKSLDSSLLSVLVHQKDSSSSAIKFMGGGAIAGEKYEQSVFANLSDISLGVDDVLNINVPKAATSPINVVDLIGFNLNTFRRGQQFYSGKHINFISGIDNIPSGLGSEISDITFTIGTTNPSIPAKFSVATTLVSASARFEIGGNITSPTIINKTGTILGEANNIAYWGNTVSMIAGNSGTNNRVRVNTTGILLRSLTGPINIQTPGVGQDINVVSSLNINLTGSEINQTANIINISTAGTGNIYLEPSTSTHSLQVDNVSIGNGGIKMKGNVTWGGLSYQSPANTTYRHIHINGDGLTPSEYPIIVLRQSTGSSVAPYMATFKKMIGNATVETVDVTTSSVEIDNTSGVNGFIGFRVGNSHVNKGDDFGIQTVGRDSVSNNIRSTFHAKEDTTTVGNRFQYERRVLSIDPLIAGISNGSVYTIPDAYLDSSFLDVQIVGGSGSGVINASGDSWVLQIPDGLYSGQRLNLHVVVAPSRRYDGAQYNWPNGSTGNITIRIQNFVYTVTGNTKDLATISCTEWDASPGPSAGEFFAELLWIGQTYTSYFIDNSSTSAMYGLRGWAVTNVLSPTTGATAATNTEAQMEGTFRLAW